MADPNAANPKTTRSWRIALPLLVVLLLAGGWCVYWFSATKFAAHTLDRVIAGEAARGRVITCDQREQGGFPFRFEVTCLRPSISWQTPNGPASVRLAKLSAVALAYNLGHFIVEMSGPAEIELPPKGARPQHLHAEWENARSSLIMDILGQPGPRDFALVIDQLKVWIDENETAPPGPPALHTVHVEAHGKKHSLENSSGPDFDISFFADQIAMRDPAARTNKRINLTRVELLGTAFSVPILETRNLNAFAELWQKRGGHFDIQRLWVNEGQTALLAKGDLRLSQAGWINGNATLAITGAEAILARFISGDGKPNQTAQLALGALGMVGKPVTMENRQGVEVPVVFKDGGGTLGGFLNFELPQLYLPNPS